MLHAPSTHGYRAAMPPSPGSSEVTHPVTRDDLRARLSDVVAAADPEAGLFGPASMMWRVNRHTLVYALGITQAAFLDVAHPAIANGIADHSTLFTDPRARGHHTYAMITSIVRNMKAMLPVVSIHVSSRTVA